MFEQRDRKLDYHSSIKTYHVLVHLLVLRVSPDRVDHMGLFMSVGRDFGDKARFGSVDGGDTGRTSSRTGSGLVVV